MAGDAIAQIVEVYIKRAESILSSMEVTDSSEVPVLDENFGSGLVCQSMSIDLSDLIKEFTFEVKSSPVIVCSVVSVLDRKEARAIASGTALRAIARKARTAMKKALKDLAEKEDIPKWQQAIAFWIN